MSFWVSVGTYGCLWVFMGVYGSVKLRSIQQKTSVFSFFFLQ